MARVLVVEDHALLRHALCEILAVRGHTAIGAATGMEALAQTASPLPSVAVIDLRLPDMNGLVVFSLLRRKVPALQAIIMTGYGSTARAAECRRAGVTAYLEKSIDIDSVVGLIESIEPRGWSVALTGRPVSPIRRRLALAVVRDLENLEASGTFAAWARAIGASESSLRSWCRAAKVCPKSAFALRRGLAALVLTASFGGEPEELLGFEDPRSVARFVERYGPLNDAAGPLRPAEYCRKQQFVFDRAFTNEIIELLETSSR